LYKSGNPVPYVDGLFTAVSALCVTGLSTVDMSVYTPAGFMAILVLIEAGGLGLVSFFLLYISFSSKKMSLVSRKIVRDFFIDDVDFNPTRIILRIVGYTLLIQLVGSFLLSFELKKTGEVHNWFYGIFLYVSAFCNAGFSPYSDSLQSFSETIAIPVTIAILIIVGGLGFTVLQNVVQWIGSRLRGRKRTHLTLHSKIVFFMTAVLISLGLLVFFVAESNNAFKGESVGKRVLLSFFQSVTTRTAGFETHPQAGYTPLTKILSCVFMFIGGSPGSIAGGVKTTTFFLALCFAFRSPSDRMYFSMFRRDISYDVIKKAVGIVIKSMCFILLMFCLLMISEKANMLSGVMSENSIFFELISAFGTVGLSEGITASFTLWGKIVLILTMFAGRTGIVAMAITLHNTNYLNKVADYPLETVLVG
jgi:trk system potassium uptake protein TrkH